MRTTFISIALSLFSACSVVVAQETQPSPGAGEDELVDLTTTHHVTMNLHSATPSEAISAISKSAGINMELMVTSGGAYMPRYPTPPREFEVDNEPLAITLLHLCKTYNLSQSKMYGADGMMFVTQPPRENPFATSKPSAELKAVAPPCIQGPFAVVADQIVRDRWLDPVPGEVGADGHNAPASPAQSTLRLQLRVVTEPRITMLSMPVEPDVTEMVDDLDEPLWDPPQNGLPVQTAQYEETTITMPLRMPGADARTIASLVGSVPIRVVTRSRKIEWINLDRPGSRSEIIDGLHVTLHQLQDDLGTPMQEAIIDIDRNGVRTREWAALEDMIGHGSHIQIFDKAGNLLTDPFRWYGLANDLNLQMMVKVSGKGDHSGMVGRAYRMTWDFPIESGEVQVPFSFKNLPLPAN